MYTEYMYCLGEIMDWDHRMAVPNISDNCLLCICKYCFIEIRSIWLSALLSVIPGTSYALAEFMV